jgi:putative acetyltransferase
MFEIHPAETADHDEIVTLWHQGWHDAHANLVPPEVLAFRTKDHFTLWLNEAQDAFFAARDDTGVLGFVSLKGAEIVKLYVSGRARGTGAAQILLSFAENLLCDAGVARAGLFCTTGNIRAERFYQREGWELSESFDDALWVPEGAGAKFIVSTHRFEKDLKRP